MPIEAFRTTFLHRYVRTASVQTARSDWLEFKQQTEGTHSFNDHYRVAIQLVALVPGGSAIDGTAVHQYLEAMRPALRSRMQKNLESSLCVRSGCSYETGRACHRLT